jgi:DNA primase
VIAGIRDQALSVGYIRSLAGWLGMDPSEVTRAVNAARNATPRTSQRAPAERSSASENGSSDDVAPRILDYSLTDLPVDPPTRQERDALMAILQYPDHVGRPLVERVAAVRFTNPTLTVVRDAVGSNLEKLQTPDWVSVVTAEVPAPYASLVQQLAVGPIPSKQDRMAAYCAQVATDLIDRDLLRTKADLLGALQRTDSTSEPVKYRELQQQLVGVETERRRLRED